MNTIKTIVIVLTVIMLLSITGGLAVGVFLYKEYKEKTAYFDARTRYTINKIRDLEDNLKSLQSILDKNKMERKQVLSKIDKIKRDLQVWKRDYITAISGLRGKIEDLKIDKLNFMVENLQDNIDDLKIALQDLEIKEELKGVDLGKIAVESQEKLDRRKKPKIKAQALD